MIFLTCDGRCEAICSAKVISPLRSHRERSWDGCSDDHHDLRVSPAQQQSDSDVKAGLSCLLWWVSAHAWSLSDWSSACFKVKSKKLFCFLSLSVFFLVACTPICLNSHSVFADVWILSQNQVFCLTVMMISEFKAREGNLRSFVTVLKYLDF